jgi:hypothetical protein
MRSHRARTHARATEVCAPDAYRTSGTIATLEVGSAPSIRCRPAPAGAGQATMPLVGNKPFETNTMDGATVDEATELEGDPTLSAAQPTHKSFTRGMNPRAAVAWVRARHGEDGVQALAASLSPDMIDDLGGPSLRPGAMTWVPFMTQARLVEHIDRLFGNGDLSLLIEVGRAMAFHDFPGIARPVARLLSPGLFVDMATRIWGLYHSHGHWEVVRGERDIVAVLLGRPEHHPAFCVGMRGWIEGALLFCGATDAVAHEERCAALGGSCCSLRVMWREKRDDVRDRRQRAPL